MKRTRFILMTVLGILLVGSLGFADIGRKPLLIPDDSDHDGVSDATDQCPAVNASFFDRNGDGCVDDAAGARHTEFWMKTQMPFRYYINASGASGVGDGSDFTAVESGMGAWTAVPNAVFSVSYEGTTNQQVAAALDQVNLVTFKDSQWPTYHVSNLVLALGISTSFTVDTEYNETLYLPGQIVDADLIFNPNRQFKTSTAGSGYDIQSIVTHEAGHLFGLAHSPVATSTMFYVLPAGSEARSLEPEDEEVFFKAYGDSTLLANANRISGAVLSGTTSNPVPGAIVYAIDAASGDTMAADYTLPDGSYAFPGLANGSYYIGIQPLDGSDEIGGLLAKYVNTLVETTAVTNFLYEYYDQSESSSDSRDDKLAIAVSDGSKVADIDIVTNVDASSPEVLSITPAIGAPTVKIDAAVVIGFSERIDDGSLQGNFSLRDAVTQAFILGKASFLKDDSVIAFTPDKPLEFGRQYNLTLGTGLADIYGNGLELPYTSSFTTESMPPLAITSLAPNKGVVGSLVVINGVGFSTTPANNNVTFGDVQAEVTNAYANRLIARVPATAKTGYVTVAVGEATGEGPTFTVLSDVEIARGFQSGYATTLYAPRSLTVAPDGGYAYVATEGGIAAVVINPGLPGYLTVDEIIISGGVDELDATPDGKMVYAVSRLSKKLYALDADPSHGPLFNTVISERAMGAGPLGIIIEPSGGRAYIPTEEGSIQVWDVRRGSATFERQIGSIAPTDFGLRAKMAIDPTGRYLCTLFGSGKMNVYDVGPDTLFASATVLSNPTDVSIDPTGEHAYVSDGTGYVSVVPLSGFFTKSMDISTGGSLRGMMITRGGNFIYACNVQLGLIDIIGLAEGSTTYRSLAATIKAGTYPIDIDISPDGHYAFTLERNMKEFVVTTIGLGPTLGSLSRRAGPPGTKLVLAGTGFDMQPDHTRIEFTSAGGPMSVFEGYNTGTWLEVTVPSWATSGPVRVATLRPDSTDTWMYSNSLYFQVLDTGHSTGGLRGAAKIAAPSGVALTKALGMSPTGDFIVVGASNGRFLVVDTDPASSKFHQVLATGQTPDTVDVDYIAITPDGNRAFFPVLADTSVCIVSMNRHVKGFATVVGTIDLPNSHGSGVSSIAVSPDGEKLLVAQGGEFVNVIDIVAGSTNENRVIGTIAAGGCYEITYHPGGLYAYVADLWGRMLKVVDLDPLSPSYLSVVNTVTMPGSPPYAPLSLSFTPDGTFCCVHTVLIDGPRFRNFVVLYCGDPANPVVDPDNVIDEENNIDKTGSEKVRVSPKGDRAVVAAWANYTVFDLTTSPVSAADRGMDWPFLVPASIEYAPDASRLYVKGYYDTVFVYDFNEASYLMMISGDEQSGVVRQALAAPLRVFVGLPDSGMVGVAGVPITFKLTAGGGYFTESRLTTQVVATDGGGYAEIDWTLGSVVGVQTQTVEVTALGLDGSPMQFIADSYESSDNLPLRLVQTIPSNGMANVSATSAVQGTFTRAVNPDSITSESFFIAKMSDAVPVPAYVGFADGDRKVSLIPTAALEYGTEYVVRTTAHIRDMSDGLLENPGETEFTTAPRPPLMLSSISPPAASVGGSLVLSGKGFDATAANNLILFNDMSVAPYDAGVDYLKTVVPLGAIPGAVSVVTGNDTSNAVPFVVLVPSTSPVDEVLATINTTTSVKSVSVTPDGALAYSVSPDADVVIPIDVEGQTTYSSISVGDNPVAITIDPEGRYAYVANFGSGTVSVIVVDPDSLRFNEVVNTITVGANPIDIAVNPDGSRVYVANSGSKTLSVIDGSDSESRHSVLATVPTTSSVKSVVVTPDGTTVYGATDVGYVIFDAQSNAVTADVKLNNSVKSVTVTPDGALLIALTTEGTVLIIDLMPGPTQNTVIATITTTNTVKSVVVTPDGAMLYVLLENSDKALAYSLTVVGSSAVLEPGAPIPPPIIQLAVVDTIPTGNDPSDIAFDPSGSGLMLICNAGDRTITLVNASSVPAGPILADVVVTPHTLNLQSAGRWVTGRVELPGAFFPEEVEISSVLLQGVIHATPGTETFLDTDGDGLREIALKFDRAAFQAILPQGESVPVTITGTVRNRSFAGDDTIRTLRPVVKHPTGCVLALGEQTTITWTSPSGCTVDAVSIDWSPDDGASWIALVRDAPDTHAFPWRIPTSPCDKCRVMVTLFSKGEILGMGMSQEPFMISVPVAVMVQSFAGALEDGAAVLRWSTSLEQNVTGFNLLRSETEGGSYSRVNAAPIAAIGQSGGEYECKDERIELNRTYYYQLEEVSGRGSRVVFGPYALTARSPFALAQNAPNPFNPVTTIRFTIPEEAHVTLAVYDATGRRVRTLVDDQLRANFYKVEWNGTNDGDRQVASGIYFYRLQAGNHVKSRKMLLLR